MDKILIKDKKWVDCILWVTYNTVNESMNVQQTEVDKNGNKT
jgi:hypothetical protein